MWGISYINNKMTDNIKNTSQTATASDNIHGAFMQYVYLQNCHSAEIQIRST